MHARAQKLLGQPVTVISMTVLQVLVVGDGKTCLSVDSTLAPDNRLVMHFCYKFSAAVLNCSLMRVCTILGGCRHT
jgi:hypothetical protein